MNVYYKIDDQYISFGDYVFEALDSLYSKQELVEHAWLVNLDRDANAIMSMLDFSSLRLAVRDSKSNEITEKKFELSEHANALVDSLAVYFSGSAVKEQNALINRLQSAGFIQGTSYEMRTALYAAMFKLHYYKPSNVNLAWKYFLDGFFGFVASMHGLMGQGGEGEGNEYLMGCVITSGSFEQIKLLLQTDFAKKRLNQSMGTHHTLPLNLIATNKLLTKEQKHELISMMVRLGADVDATIQWRGGALIPVLPEEYRLKVDPKDIAEGQRLQASNINLSQSKENISQLPVQKHTLRSGLFGWSKPLMASMAVVAMVVATRTNTK